MIRRVWVGRSVTRSVIVWNPLCYVRARRDSAIHAMRCEHRCHSLFLSPESIWGKRKKRGSWSKRRWVIGASLVANDNGRIPLTTSSSSSFLRLSLSPENGGLLVNFSIESVFLTLFTKKKNSSYLSRRSSDFRRNRSKKRWPHLLLNVVKIQFLKKRIVGRSHALSKRLSCEKRRDNCYGFFCAFRNMKGRTRCPSMDKTA